MASQPQFIQAQPFSLAGAGSSIGDIVIILQSMIGIDGNPIVTADIGTQLYCTLEPGNGTQEESFQCTGITQNANGTATLTGVSSLGFKQPYTITSGLQKTHAGGSTVIISNEATFYNNIINYVNSVAIAGAPNATVATAGIAQLATAAQIAAGTATGSSGASLFMSPSAFQSSGYAVASSSVPLLTYGSGADGTVTMNGTNTYSTFSSLASSTYTLSRDIYTTNLTISMGITLVTGGFRIYVTGATAGGGTLTWGTPNNGGNGTNGTNSTIGTGGVAGLGASSGFLRNISGAAGGNGGQGSGAGSAGTAGGSSINGLAEGTNAGSGAAGGSSSGAGGAGGVGGTSTTQTAVGVFSAPTLLACDVGQTGFVPYLSGGGGGGAGGGGGDGSGGHGGGGGGGGGASGGTTFLAVNTWAGSFNISNVGGNGGTGGAGSGGSGGTGGGGTGGMSIVVYNTKTWTGNYILTGGTGGTNGTTGTSYEIKRNTLTI